MLKITIDEEEREGKGNKKRETKDETKNYADICILIAGYGL